jgi:hypothetical protein
MYLSYIHVFSSPSVQERAEAQISPPAKILHPQATKSKSPPQNPPSPAQIRTQLLLDHPMHPLVGDLSSSGNLPVESRHGWYPLPPWITSA